STLRQGDLVFQFDGEPVFQGADSIDFLRDYLLRTQGKTVELQIMRDGKAQTLTVALQPKEKEDKARYLRLLPDKTVGECTFTVHRGDKGWSIASVTERGATKMTVTARYDAQDMLTAADATLVKGEQKTTARVEITAGKAKVKRDGQDA